MVGKKNIRSYEVSIWTLQDSFITVLKPLNLEHKGAIQDGKITLQDDGENRISFSIPMYIREKGEFIENPLWYNTEDGNLIVNLRKLKVIFNKRTKDEKIFEFIITKVVERHEGYEKICEVEGEGLAFNELGKQGYKISLSEEDLNYETKDLNEAAGIDDVVHTIYIKNNLNYWVDKVLAGTNWRYSIQMDWAISDGIIDQDEDGATRYEDLTEEQRDTLNWDREHLGLKRHDVIYEDTYVASWSLVNDTLIPARVVSFSEKLKTISSQKSNRYNLIQTIAEIFGVYTKFKYYYDDNYHIIDREIIFYNNFLDEKNVIDLTYSYDTQSISRELNAADIITKMYVKNLEDSNSPTGLISIAETEANKTGEDYILNFDYLYDIKTISEEQYAAIKTFEKKVFNLNNQLMPLGIKIAKKNDELLDAEIARDNAKIAMEEAEDNIAYTDLQLAAIYDDSDYEAVKQVTLDNPALVLLAKQEDNTYKGTFGSQYSGIVPNTVQVYSKKTDSSSTVKFIPQVADDMIQSLTFSNAVGTSASNGYLYATFNYKPALTKEKVKENYIILRNKNKKIWEDNSKKALDLENDIAELESTQDSLLQEKADQLSDFEKMMGPALREGNWQPEDEYANYGEQYDETIQPSYLSTAINSESGKLRFIWDNELFDEEEKNYYEFGINQDKVYYPCIDLTKLNSSNFFEKLKDDTFRNGLSFVYKNENEANPYLLPQGTNCRFAFIQATSGGNIIPVLMLTNLYSEINITNDDTALEALAYCRDLTSYIAYADIDTLLGNITADNSTIFSVPNNAWISQPHKYKTIYARLEVQSDYMKTGANDIFISMYRDYTVDTGTYYSYIKNLEEFTDYYIFSRDEKKYITIKPEVLLEGKIGEAKIKINYRILNTALQVYLDAIDIMKENAYPKVSYTISNLSSYKLLHDTYNRLGQLAHINDAKLKFNNVIGYISAVELNLDKPWEDSITIQNYKSKFEDLFSTITAQTEEMKKNALKINTVISAFSADGQLIAPITQESLLKSPQVINALIKNNADVIAARTAGEAAKNKAALASTEVYRVMHGEIGLAFKGSQIDSVVLNQDNGLIVAGSSGGEKVFFQLDNSHMGFFKGTPGTFDKTNMNERPVPQLYYENGDLALAGTVYAANGWFGGSNGWIIGSDRFSNNNTTTGLGGLLYSANGKAIFTSLGGGDNKTDPMIILTKTGFSLDEQNAALLFDGTNLYINGTITSIAGDIGGWHIGPSYLGNETTQLSSTVGMASGKDSSEQSQKYSFWAGRAYSDTPLFSVTPGGYLTSTSGSIGGWTIGSNWLGSGNSRGGSKVGMTVSDNDDTLAFWAGATSTSGGTVTGYKFGVTQAGKLTATDADISGSITATSGTFTGEINARSGTIGQEYAPQIKIGSSGNTSTSISYIYSSTKSTLDSDSIDGFYLGTNGLALGKGLFKVTDTGSLTAKSGTIGGWSLGDSALYLNGPTPGSTTLMLSKGTKSTNSIGGSPANTEKIWMISASDKFGVTTAGDLYANSANITGTITANKGQIGQLRISQNQLYYAAQNKFIGIFPNRDDYVFAIGGTLTSTDTSTGDISFKDLVFKVTGTGQLYATGAVLSGSLTSGSNFSVTSDGVVTAKSGTIGGWTIGENYIGNGTSRRGGTKPSTVGMSCPGENITAFAFWAGGELADGTDPIDSIPFYVRANGALHASKAYITGKVSATSGSFGNGTNKITVTTDGANSAIYGGSKATYTSTNNGFYIGTNGIALGKYNSTSKHSPFEVNTDGTLYASGATITGATKINTTEDLLIKTSTTDKAGCVIKTTTSIIEGQDESEMFLTVGKKSKISLNQYGLGLKYGSDENEDENDENDPSIWISDDNVDLSGENISLYSKNISIRANALDNDFGETSFRLFLENGHTNSTKNGILIDVSPAFVAGSTPNSSKTTYQGRGTWVPCEVYVKISSNVSYEA